jgi:hypothetical protein
MNEVPKPPRAQFRHSFLIWVGSLLLMCGAVAVAYILIDQRLNRASTPDSMLASAYSALPLFYAMPPVLLGGLLILAGIIKVNLANRRPPWLDSLIRWFLKMDRP